MNSDPGRKDAIGWIGIGRMGYAMAERLAKAGADLTVWNRTRAKAEPLAARRREGRGQARRPRGVRHRVRHGVDLGRRERGRRRARRACCRAAGAAEAGRRVLVDLARRLGRAARAAARRAASRCWRRRSRATPRSSRPAGCRSSARGRARRSTRRCRYLRMIAPAASYVGEGELARIVKICHNVFLGVVTSRSPRSRCSRRRPACRATRSSTS